MKSFLILILISLNCLADDNTLDCRSYILNNETGVKTCVGQYIEEEKPVAHYMTKETSPPAEYIDETPQITTQTRPQIPVKVEIQKAIAKPLGPQ